MTYEIYLTLGLAVLFFSVGLGVGNEVFRRLSIMYSMAFLLLSAGKYLNMQAVFADKLLEFLGYAIWVLIFYLNYRFVISEKAEQDEKYKDPLTGVGNRLYFEKLLKDRAGNFERLNIPYVVFFIDMDNLKVINDTYGHEAGDEAIKDLARVIKQNTRRDKDKLARVGGDEFVLLAPVRACSDALVLISRIENALEELNKQRDFNISFSLGFACYPDDGKHFDELLKLADKRMYQIKFAKKG